MKTPLISFTWNNLEDFLNFDNHNIKLNQGNTSTTFPFSNLISIKLGSKKKLAPLIIGAVITSLALVNILLVGSSLTMIGLLSIGLLILYVGLSEYWVITFEQFQDSKSIWISKNKCRLFPITLINIMDYRVQKGFFPPIHASISRTNLGEFVASNHPAVEINLPLTYFLIPPIQTSENLLLKVDLSILSHPLTFVANKDFIATGNFQIDKEALINIEI